MGDTESVNARNLLGLDYRAEAGRMGPPVVPILDVHTHVNGARASEIYREVMSLYGIRRTYSQSIIDDADGVVRALGDGVRFIATPRYHAEDKVHALTDGYMDDLDIWAGEYGSRCMKIWNAPRLIDFAEHFADEGMFHPSDLVPLDSPWRRKLADKAIDLGMMFMTHVADPDTWFATKYSDASRYGEKASHYEALERMLEWYRVPWIAAHMGGWPEDLVFLDGLLERHSNLLLDTSATKWMVRELSKHPREELVGFLKKHEGRVLFGSDIVTRDEHLVSAGDATQFASELASSEEEAFELYASRYWLLRTFWETGYEGGSNISDPDLAMVEPDRYSKLDGAALRGAKLDGDMLGVLYSGAAEGTIEKWYDERL